MKNEHEILTTNLNSTLKSSFVSRGGDHDLSDRAAEKRVIRKPRFYTGIIGFEFDSRL
jgi:hypothetical protein